MLKNKLIRWLSRPVLDRSTNVAAVMPIVLATDIGLQRGENQDRVAAMRVNSVSGASGPFTVMALADGMGGMTDGANCAVHALATFFDCLAVSGSMPPLDRLELATHAANAAVFELYRGNGGATLSAVLFCADEQPILVNVGDSRIYATFESATEGVTRLTVDDSLEEFVGGHGKELLQFIGMGDGLKAHIKMVGGSAHRLLITSDGIHFVSHDTLSDVFSKAPDVYRATERLAALARWCGAPDNASLAMADVPDIPLFFGGREESGVEVWDPFSSVHIMWMKNAEALESHYAASSLVPKEPVKDRAEAQEITKKPPASKKSRKPRSQKVEKIKEPSSVGPQLTIEIDDGSSAITPENNGDHA